MVRFEGQAAISMVVVPFANSTDLSQWTENNFIDKFAADKSANWASRRRVCVTTPSSCVEPTSTRLAHCPRPPTRQLIIDSQDPDKRKKLVDRLLGLTGDPAQDIYNDQYAALWSLKWSDLIRSNSNDLGAQGMWALHNWIKRHSRRNKPIDQFTKEL